MTQADATPAPPPARPRPRWRRRITWLLGAVLLLAGIAAGIVQAILSSDIPRQRVIAELESKLGLRITADSLRTTWSGHAVLTNVRAYLPLEGDEPILSAPRLEVRHTPVLRLLVDRSIKLRRIEADRPVVRIAQDRLGRWNVQEALLLAQAPGGAGGGATSGAPAAAAIDLPDLQITGATAIIRDSAGRTTALSPIDISGSAGPAGVWKVLASVEGHAQVNGRIVTGRTWRHELAIALWDLERPLSPWQANLPRDMALRGRWAGWISGGRIAGRLEIDQAQAGDSTARGMVDVDAAPGGTTLALHGIQLHDPRLREPARVAGGRIRIDGAVAHVEALRLSMGEGLAYIDGELDWRSLVGSVRAVWSDVALPADARHGGSAKVRVSRSPLGGPAIQADLATAGTSRAGAWRSTGTLTAQGRSWSKLQWSLAAPSLVLTSVRGPLDLSGLELRGRVDAESARIDSARIAGTRVLDADGSFVFATRRASLRLDLRDQAVPGLGAPLSVSLLATADFPSGELPRIQVSRCDLATGPWGASIAGSYDAARPEALEATLTVSPASFALNDPGHHAVVRGGMSGMLRVTGSLAPRNLALRGTLRGQGVILADRPIGDVEMELTGGVDEQAAHLRSTELRLLGGAWTLDSAFSFEDATGRLVLEVTDLPVAQVVALAGRAEHVEGLARAGVRAVWPIRTQPSPTVTGDWRIERLAGPFFSADQAGGTMRSSGDLLVLDEIVLRKGAGTGRARVQLDMRGRKNMAVNLAMTDWPVGIPEAELAGRFSARGELAIDLAARSATGPLEIDASGELDGTHLGKASMQLNLRGRQVDVRALHITTMEGRIDGTAMLAGDDWKKSTAAVTFTDLRPASMSPLAPWVESFAGTLSGAITAGPDADPRAIGPYRMRLTLAPEKASYNGLEIGPADLVVHTTGTRFVLSSSSIHLADGTAQAWARLTRHEGQWLGLAKADFDRLQLRQLVSAADPAAEPMVGRLAGQLSLLGSPRDWRRLTGDLSVKLTESDLVNSDIVGAVYQVMSVQPGGLQPTGQGNARVRVEDGRLQLRHAEYFHRGVEIRARMTVDDLSQGTQSPLRGYAVGTLRPLRDLKLPLVPELDDLLDALQGSATALRIGGTVASPKPVPAVLSEVGQDLKSILLGDDGGQ